MRLKFSLRMLFLATAIVATICYWLVLPSINAQRFVAAVAAENYELADACFRDSKDRLLFDWNEKHWRFKAKAGLEPWSFRHLIQGQRLISLTVIYGDAGPTRILDGTVVATRAGLLSPQFVRSRGLGGFGLATHLNHTLPSATP